MTERITKKQLVAMIQAFEAVNAIGGSAVRGQPKGTVDVCREFLTELNLAEIPHQSPMAFGKWLDQQTRRLRGRLPSPKKPWGIARKALNLFLRSCLYNRFISERYRLHRIEPWLEIPLDGVVARELKKRAGRGRLPHWLGLKGVTPEESYAFQQFALEYAARRDLPARVFLDNYLWLQGR